VNPNHNPSETFPLHDACRKGNFEKVVKLLQSGNVDVNKTNPSGDSALHLACAGGHTGIVEQLLLYAAALNVNNRLGRTPLHEASANGHADFVTILCEHDAVVNVIDLNGKTPLVDASERGHKDIVRILTEHEADVNLDSSSMIGAGFLKKKRPFPKLPDLQLPLMSAVTMGYEEIVEHLLVEGAHVNKPNSEGWTELHMASYNGNVSIVELLVRHGASIDAVTELGATALGLASQEGYANVVSFLLNHGADLNHTQSDGATPIMLAAQFGHDKVVDMLMKHHASTTAVVNGKTTSAIHLALQGGYSETTQLMLRCTHFLDLDFASTLLLIASYTGDVNVVKMLLALGVNAEVYMVISGNEKVTPLMNAAHTGQTHVVDVLLSHGAHLNVSWLDGRITPLIAAIHFNHTGVVDVILDYAKDRSVDLLNTGYGPEKLTPLEQAAHIGHVNTFNCLLNHGADPMLKKVRQTVPSNTNTLPVGEKTGHCACEKFARPWRQSKPTMLFNCYSTDNGSRL
jgi:ankyrin